MYCIDWIKALRALADEHGVPEESRFALGLRRQRENFSALQFGLGRSLEVEEPLWDQRIIRRELTAIGDFADSLIDEGRRDKDESLKKLGCRIRAACTDLREGMAEAGVRQVQTILLTPEQSRGFHTDPAGLHQFAVDSMLQEQDRRRAEIQGSPAEAEC